MIHLPTSPITPGLASQLIQKVQQGISPVELVYAAHERWPLRPGQVSHTHPTLRISVLDSSFNPPTLAHLALANSSLPRSSSQPATSTGSYDARMLLLSVRNVDKTLRPGDATFPQRLEMMRLLAHDIRSADSAESGDESSQTGGNVAVAIIDEPTFVGKSALLLHFLRARLATVAESASSSDRIFDERGAGAPCPFPSPKLTFLLGFDTLIRLFSPKYYPSEQAMVQMLRTFFSPDEDDCRIVCAYRRSTSVDETFQETQLKTLEVAHEFIASTQITFINIGLVEQTYSSSEVRTKVAVGNATWRRLVTDMIAQYIVKQGIYTSLEKKQ